MDSNIAGLGVKKGRSGSQAERSAQKGLPCPGRVQGTEAQWDLGAASAYSDKPCMNKQPGRAEASQPLIRERDKRSLPGKAAWTQCQGAQETL